MWNAYPTHCRSLAATMGTDFQWRRATWAFNILLAARLANNFITPSAQGHGMTRNLTHFVWFWIVVNDKCPPCLATACYLCAQTSGQPNIAQTPKPVQHHYHYSSFVPLEGHSLPVNWYWDSIVVCCRKRWLIECQKNPGLKRAQSGHVMNGIHWRKWLWVVSKGLLSQNSLLKWRYKIIIMIPHVDSLHEHLAF